MFRASRGMSPSAERLLTRDQEGANERYRWLDEHSANVYRRVAMLRRQLIVLSLVLAAALGGVLAIATWKPIELDGDRSGPRAWVWVFLFGALGGCLTALRSVSARSPGSRIPEQREQWLVTAARPLIGSAAALLAYALLEAQIVSVGPETNGAALLVVAFAAGFSERLVMGAVEAVAGKEPKASLPPPRPPP
jgi:peptidoglycan/LPS O-acetylase OafA/YrhL